MSDKNSSKENTDPKSKGATNPKTNSKPEYSPTSTLVGSSTAPNKEWSLDDAANLSVPPASMTSSRTTISSSKPSPKSIIGAIKLAKPHSRTAIGQLTQPILLKPSLYATDILVESSMGKSWEPVNSRRLKFEAVDKWLDKIGFNFEYKHFIQVGATQGVVRVILIVPGKQYENEAKRRFKSASKEPLDGLKKIVKTKQGEEEHKVRCRIRDPGHNSHDSEKIFTDAFDFILRDILAHEDYLEVLPLADGSIESLEPKLRGRPRTADSLVPLNYKLHFRIQPSSDVGFLQILMDVDIVPCFPQKALYEVVLDLVGRSGNAAVNVAEIARLLPSIADSLRGLKVRCSYVPGRRIDGRKDKATMLTEADMDRGRVFYIKDIEMPNDDPDAKFDLNGNKVSVYEYFEQVHFQGTSTLNTHLPLVRDDTGALIPLELVHLDGVQPLTRYGHLNEFILKTARRFLKQGGASRIEALGARFVDAFPKLTSSEGNLQLFGPTKFFHGSLIAPVKELKWNVDFGVGYGMISVVPSANRTAVDPLLEKVHRGLCSILPNVGSPITVFKNDLDNNKFEPQIAGTNFVFVLVEDRGQTKRDTEKIVRQLHQLADQRMGILMVCAMTSHLEKLYNRPLDQVSLYVPANIRYKVHYMLGKQNFGYNPVSKIPDTPLMIAGGHTAHITGNKEYCPSVSAVVATTSATGIHYLGSTCIQVTNTAEKRESDGVLVRKTISGVVDMSRMMQERFRAFDVQPARLLYYHDSTTFDDEANTRMCQQIEHAYGEVYPNTRRKLHLTYIVVNKNTNIAYNCEKAPEQGKIDPLLDFVTDDAGIPKHRYYVIRNDDNMSADDLCSLTLRINTSTQLSRSPIATSLPTLFANKLCTRVLSYFRYDMHFPEIKRVKQLTQESMDEEHRAEKNARSLVEKFLGIEETGGERLKPWKKKLDGRMFYL